MAEIYRDNNDLISSFTEKERMVSEDNVVDKAINEQRSQRISVGSKGQNKIQAQENNPFNSYKKSTSPVSNSKSKGTAGSPVSYNKLFKGSHKRIQEVTEPGSTLDKNKSPPLNSLSQQLKSHMEKHGLLYGKGRGQEKLVSIFEDSFDQIQMALTQSEVSGIMKEAQQIGDDNIEDKTKAELEQLEGFIVSVMRNFFLDLSVDQIEVLCTNFAQRFIQDNREDKPQEKEEPNHDDQTPQPKGMKHYSPKRKSRINQNFYQSEQFPFEPQSALTNNNNHHNISVKPPVEQNTKDNMPEDLLERTQPSNFDQSKNLQFQKMLKEEDNVSKNFQSNFGDIPQVQESAMNKNLKSQYPKRTVPPLFKKAQTFVPKEKDAIEQRIESITERYNNVPRYMSPTIVAKQKYDLKKRNILDNGDQPKYDLQLRKPDNASYSPERHLQQIRQVWKPQSGNVVANGFCAMKPAPKLQKCLTYRKMESPLQKDPKRQDEFFNRLHTDHYKKEKGRYDLYVKGIKDELNKCTFVPNHQRVLSRVSGSKGIKIFQDRDQYSDIEQRDDVSYQAMNQQINAANTDRPGMEYTRRGTQPFLTSLTPEKPDNYQIPQRRQSDQVSPAQKLRTLFQKNKSVHQIRDGDDEDKTAKDYQTVQTVQNSAEKLRSKKDLFEYLAKEGQKKTKIELLEQQQKMKQLEDCTFKPSIIKNYKPKFIEGSTNGTQESGEEGNKNLNVYEKLNKFAKEKDMKLRDYQEAQQWRELKDCTFKPQINTKKKETFHKKRKSNSVMAIMRNSESSPNIDTYYKKLNEAHPQASLINNKNGENREVAAKKMSQKNDDDNKGGPISRHDLLYNSKQVYNERKQLIKDEIMKERNKNNTFQPSLYKSKVSPNRQLNYQVYQKPNKRPQGRQEETNRRTTPNVEKRRKWSNMNRDPYQQLANEEPNEKNKDTDILGLLNEANKELESRANKNSSSRPRASGPNPDDQFFNTNYGNTDRQPPISKSRKPRNQDYWSTTVKGGNRKNDINSNPDFESMDRLNGYGSKQRKSPDRGSQTRNQAPEIIKGQNNIPDVYVMPLNSENDSNLLESSGKSPVQSAARYNLQRKSKKERQVKRAGHQNVQ